MRTIPKAVIWGNGAEFTSLLGSYFNMPVASKSLSQSSSYAPARILPDRRRHCRVALTLLGRFMRVDRSEYPCKLMVISVSGASIMSTTGVEIDEPIVAYFDALGGIEGRVRRLFEGGYTISLHATQARRERLAAQLTWLINRHEMDGVDGRRFERVSAAETALALTLNDNTQVLARILDVSLSGASIASEARPDVGSIITLGKYRGQVTRHHDNGFGIEFIDIDASQMLSRHFS